MTDVDQEDDEYPDEDEDEDEDSNVGPREPWWSRRRGLILVVTGVVVVGLVVGLVLALSGGGSSAAIGPEGVAIQNAPDLAPASTTAPGTPVGGITCRTSKNQVVNYHIHIHVAIFVDGQQKRLPAGAGIAAPRLDEHFQNGLFVDNFPGTTGCLYWLHVHANDGVIHVESPYKHTFTLGQFFDIWRQPLGPDQVGPATGKVTAFVNGQQFSGNPRDLPLLPHAVVQLDVGTVVPFQPVTFTVKGLCGAGTHGCAIGSPAEASEPATAVRERGYDEAASTV